MPAMPAEIMVRKNKHISIGEMFSGLTKREHFAGLVVPPHKVLIETLKQAFPDGFTPAQYIEVAVGYKIQEADALLEALEANDEK